MKNNGIQLVKWLLTAFLALPLLAPAVLAQAPRVHNIDPSAIDPLYDARKNSASQGPRPSQAAVLARPTAALAVVLPDCFEAVDTVSSPANGGFTDVPRGDDNSIGPIALGFNFSLFGTVYNSCYINTNGNITFTGGLSTFSSSGFPISDIPMVAAFWADLDTRNLGSGRVWYKVYPDRLVIFWNRVNYYTGAAANTPLKNTFQLIIRRNTVAPVPSPDVTFAYGDMQWTTGDASAGSGGFGGTPATVGVNEGTGTGNYIQTGRFNDNSATPPLASYPANTVVFSGVDWLDGRCVNYSLAPAGNLPPTATGFPSSNTITVNQGQTVALALQFAAPEAGQTTTVMVNTNGLCNTAAPISGGGGSPIVNLSVTGASCNIGTHVINFTAVDNGTPVGTSNFTLTVIVNPLASNQWTGAVSTAYALPGNWSAGVVPGATDDVVIPATAIRMPLLTTAQAAANFTVATGATLTVGTGGELTLNGNLTANGPATGPGAVRTAGASAQTLGGTSGLNIGNLTIGAATAGLTGPLQVSRTLVLNGNLTTNAQPCTLLSDATGTAMVVNNGTAQVMGNVLVQRYIDPSINPGLGYRQFSAPVQNTTLADLTVTGLFAPLINPAYNTAAVPGAVTPFPTVYSLDETRITAARTDFDWAWVSPTSLANPMVPGLGYTVNIGSNLTVDFLGALNNGPISRTNLTRGAQFNSGWHLLGNPYPAPLDWNLVYPQTTGLDNAVYVFKSTGQYTGSYLTYVNGVGNSSARYLGVAQGFLVRASQPGTAGTLPFANSMRLTAYQNVTLQRSSAAADQRPQLRLDLVASNQQTRETYVYFENGATAGFDRVYDAYQVPTADLLSLATGTGALPLAINGLPILAADGNAVPLVISVAQPGTYTLRVGSLLNFDPATSLWLEDRQSGTWQDLRQQPSLAFATGRLAEATTRFVLHIGQARTALATTAQLPAEAVQVYPNPASSQLNVQLMAMPKDAASAQLALTNMLGQTVRQQNIALHGGAATATFDLKGLAPGIYTLRGTTQTQTFSRSVVVE